MKIGLVVATFRRSWIVCQFLSAIQSQSRLPEEIVLSVVEPSDVPDLSKLKLPTTKVIYGEAGSCAQRNRGIDYLRHKVDVILFLDDDFWLGSNYIDQLKRIFEADPTIVGVTGYVISDGATSCGHTVSEAERLIADYEAKRPAVSPRIKEIADAYGCNMAFRSDIIDRIRFDERLPLYGWQEDVDFSAQLRSLGPIVWTDKIWGVHLGTKVGKTSGVRFGYSQVINPFYIVKKGNMSAKRAAILVLKNILANMVKSIAPESYIDRRGRLRGNLIGLLHLVTGRLNPEYVLSL
jgi:GT2 family glycosyltransferase